MDTCLPKSNIKYNIEKTKQRFVNVNPDKALYLNQHGNRQIKLMAWRLELINSITYEEILQ